MVIPSALTVTLVRRAPHGACELKSGIASCAGRGISRAPHGACELKCVESTTLSQSAGRAPHGACELKFINKRWREKQYAVAPRMGRVS